MPPFKTSDTVLIVTESEAPEKVSSVQKEVGSNGKVVPVNMTQLSSKTSL